MKNPSFALAGLLVASPFAGAATLQISNATTSPGGSVYNINDYGAVDWAIWKRAAANPGSGYEVPSESKSGATAISNLTNVGGGTAGFRASVSSYPDWDFSFTGGTAASSGTITDANGIFHPDTGSAGKGMGLTVTLPTTGTYVISLFVAGYNTTTSLTASLIGASNVANTSFTPNFPDDYDNNPATNNPKDMALFQITATADNAGDAVTLQMINTALSNPGTPGNPIDGSGHVMISAVAVQLIPEPSTAAVALLSTGFFAFRRRRIIP